MRGSLLLLFVGLFLGYLAVSGKYCCITQFLSCAASDAVSPCQCVAGRADTAVSADLGSLLPFSSGGLIYPYA